MQTVVDMRGVGVKKRGKCADVLCGRPLSYIFTRNFLFETIHKTAFGQKYLGSVSRVVIQSIIIIPAMRHS